MSGETWEYGEKLVRVSGKKKKRQEKSGRLPQEEEGMRCRGEVGSWSVWERRTRETEKNEENKGKE